MDQTLTKPERASYRLPRSGSKARPVASDRRRKSLQDTGSKVGLLGRGKRVPSILVVERLAAALGTSMSALFRAVEKLDD